MTQWLAPTYGTEGDAPCLSCGHTYHATMLTRCAGLTAAQRVAGRLLADQEWACGGCLARAVRLGAVSEEDVVASNDGPARVRQKARREDERRALARRNAAR